MTNSESEAKSIFYRYLRQQPSDRDAFLEETCGLDKTLRQEVKALLEFHDGLGTFMDEPVALESFLEDEDSVFSEDDTWDANPTKTTPASPGILVPNYEIIRELGHGGMGVVYLARQIPAKRLVALKVLSRLSLRSETNRIRFRLEAEAIARLQHPGIVQIFEVGEQDHQPFFSLEYCSAGSLDRYLSGTPVAPKEAAKLVLTLAKAVAAAHDARIIHRDLKPANVLLKPRQDSLPKETEPDPSRDERPPLHDFTVKLTDFGLSKQLDEVTQTQTGLIMGTPSYMSPEQTRTNGKVDFATDVYSLGAVLYECLTGRPPFKAASGLETILQVSNEEPAPPRQLQPNVPKDLETICLKCLNKNPVRRYDSANALADDLQRFLDHRPIAARPAGPLEHGWRLVQRNPLITGLVMTILLVLVTGIVATSTLMLQAQANFTQATIEKKKAETQTELAQQERAEANLQKQNAIRAEGKALVLAKEKSELAEKEKKERLRAERALYYLALQVAQDAWNNGNISYAGEVLAQCNTEHQDWEYQYLYHRFFSRGRMQLVGHTQPVRELLFSPDGKYLVSKGSTEFLIWNLPSKKKVKLLPKLTGGFRFMAFVPDASTIAIVPFRGDIRLWDCRTGKEKPSVHDGKKATVNILDYVPPSRTIVKATVPMHTNQESYELQKERLVTDNIVQSMGRDFLLHETLLFDTKSLKKIRALGGPYSVLDPYFCLGDQQVVWRKMTFLEFVNLKTGKVIGKMSDAEPIDKLCVAPDGIHFAIFTNEGKRDEPDLFVNGTVKLGDLRTRKWLATYRGHSCRVTSLAFAPNNRYLASGGKDGNIFIWDTQQQSDPTLLKDGNAELISFFPSGKLVAAVGRSNQLRLYRPTGGEPIRTITGNARIDCVSFSPDGKLIATGETDSQVHLRDADTGKEMFAFKMGQGNVYLVAFSPDGKHLAGVTYGNRGKLQVWNFRTRQSVLVSNPLRSYPMALAFSPDGNTLALTEQDGSLRVWDLRTKTTIIDETANTPIFAVAFSPDGKLIATGDNERRVILQDATTGKILHTFQGHNAGVTGVSFSPDGARLASCGRDGIVKLWNPSEKEEVFSLSVNQSNQRSVLTGVSFSPDGRFLATVCPQKGIIIWDSGKIVQP